MAEIALPNGWQPRPYQLPAWGALERGVRRALLVWHRRSGKDDLCLHWTACASIQRAGNYWHMLPMQEQARKAIWTAVNPHTGMRRIDEAFPREVRASTREDEMSIRFVNGAVWQVVGSDNYNSLVGSPPIGVVFSEWALAKPEAWAFLRPILAENGGWALFNTTPRGKNHAHKMLAGARDDPEWFTQVLPATQTSVFTPQQLERERQELIREYGDAAGQAMYEQEYLCSFDAAFIGAYYGSTLRKCEDDGRITEVPVEASLPVHVAMDIGIADSTAMVWWQMTKSGQVRVIDAYEASGYGLDHYVQVMHQRRDARGFTYGTVWAPHDIEVRELGTGKSRLEVLRSLGVPARVLPQSKVQDGINAVRQVLPRCWFDAKRCAGLLEALRAYRERYDEKHDVGRGPLHDWSSHYADAMRYAALAMRVEPQAKREPINYPKSGVI